MSETVQISRLRAARDHVGFAREAVCRQLDPPVSTKTLERWEDNPEPLTRKRWRLVQLAAIYSVPVEALTEDVAA